VVHYFGHGYAEEDNAFWLIMEVLDGGNLEIYANQKTYSEAMVLQVPSQIWLIVLSPV
jgi:serine/threonine protein kinase